jgi:hypothetical protein
MRRLIVGLAAVVALAGVACGTNLGAVVENPRPVAEGANPDLVAMVAAFDSMTPEQQEDYCFDVVTKGELSAAFTLVYDENGAVRPGLSVQDLPELAQLVASTAHYRCVVRAGEFG